MTWRDEDGRVIWKAPRGSVLHIGIDPGYQVFLRDDGVFYRDSREDEDPRHQFCDAKTHDHRITWCHRCNKGYVELAGLWMEAQTPGWSDAKKTWQEVDPLHRDHKQARRDFESSTCEGERRMREEWGP